MKHWTCEYCATQGTTPDHEMVESVQCPSCGEPVVEGL